MDRLVFFICSHRFDLAIVSMFCRKNDFGKIIRIFYARAQKRSENKNNSAFFVFPAVKNYFWRMKLSTAARLACVFGDIIFMSEHIASKKIWDSRSAQKS